MSADDTDESSSGSVVGEEVSEEVEQTSNSVDEVLDSESAEGTGEPGKLTGQDALNSTESEISDSQCNNGSESLDKTDSFGKSVEENANKGRLERSNSESVRESTSETDDNNDTQPDDGIMHFLDKSNNEVRTC